MMKSLAGLAGLSLCASLVVASESIPFDSPRWQIAAEENRIEEYKGKTSLVLRGGLALVADAEFTDGVIEYFCAFPDARAFVGATWRVQDAANREEFYIPYEFDTWIPVKIIVSGDQAEVYVGGLETPALFIDDLKRDKASGAVGLAVPNFGAVRFADFRYVSINAPKLDGRVERERVTPAGAVTAWQVSDPFAEMVLEGSIEINPSQKNDLKWATLKSEPTGLANLSTVSVLTREANTVFARITVVSDRAQAKTLAFGYSDRLRLFLNDRLLYTGNNGYRTRDYRYLGTIGYFDAVTLPLQKGKNELWFAVSESFGGWGVQAAFEDTEGLTFVE
jgi:hypothetical protein